MGRKGGKRCGDCWWHQYATGDDPIKACRREGSSHHGHYLTGNHLACSLFRPSVTSVSSVAKKGKRR